MAWILLALLALCVAAALVLLLRKIPQLRVIDVDSIPKERERKMKEQIILSKLQRKSGAQFKKLTRVTGGALAFFSRHGRRLVQRLYRLEQYYQKLKRSSEDGLHAYSDDAIRSRLEEASAFAQEEEYIPAEKIYIDIISHNPKSVDGYEALGNMYLAAHQLDQARETLQFALRLSPNDASVNVSLAELEEALGEPKKALPYLRKAIEKRPKNPRYLDYYIEVALEAGSLKDARLGIQALKEVNPENHKLPDFEQRLQEKKEEYVSRTTSSQEDASQNG